MTTLKQSHDALLAALKEIDKYIGGEWASNDQVARASYACDKAIQAAEALNAQPDVQEGEVVYQVRAVTDYAEVPKLFYDSWDGAKRILYTHPAPVQPEETCDWELKNDDAGFYYATKTCGDLLRKSTFCPGCGKKIRIVP